MKCGLILWAGLGMTAVAGAAVPWVVLMILCLLLVSFQPWIALALVGR